MYKKKIIFSMDVEHDIQNRYNTKSVEKIIPIIIKQFKERNILGEFFISSDILVNNKEIIFSLKDENHSLGNHNLVHSHLHELKNKDQEEQIRTSSKIFKDILGSSPKIFRAPNFSINNDTMLILESLGYEIDSSVFPAWKRKNSFLFYKNFFPSAYNSPYHPSIDNFLKKGSMKILEVPVSHNPLCRNCPIGGGGLLKFGLDKMIEIVDNQESNLVILLFHPWELIDNHINNVDGIPIVEKFDKFIYTISEKYDFILFKDIKL